MRKKVLIIAVAFLLILASVPVFAAEGGEKGASSQAYEHASEQAIFHRVGDWFATIGKSAEEKAKILEQRKMERERKRAEKQLEKAQKEAQKLKKKQESEVNELRTRATNRTENKVKAKAGTTGKGKN